MNDIARNIEQIGVPIRVETNSGWQEGKGVLYPVRYQQQKWGGVEHIPEGYSDDGRYVLFCPCTLLADSHYGSEIVQGNHRFVLVWKDDYSESCGGYTKAGLKKMTEESEDGQ